MRDRSVADRLGVLDGLRGLAILMVVWYHLWLVSGYTVPLLGFAQVVVQNGFLGVDLFFFLSGFCIALPYARARRDGRPSPRLSEFVRKRVLKIVPSYFLALAIFAFAFRDQFDGPLTEFEHLLAHATFVHVFSPITFGTFSGPLWTLAIEVQFYVLFAVVAPYVVRRPLVAYAAFVAVSVLYRLTIAALGLDGDFGWINQLPAVLDVFGAGVAASFAYTLGGRRGRVVHPALATTAAVAAGVFAVAGLSVAVGIAASGGDDAVHRWLNAWRVAFGPLLFVATLGLLYGSPALGALASTRTLRGLSLVSYCAYLFNLEIIVAFARIGMPPVGIFWFGFAGTLAAAYVVTYGFERPIVRNGWRVLVPARRAREPAPLLAGAAEPAL